jgi:VWFA-related protein
MMRRTLAALCLSTAVLAAQTSFRTSVQYVTVDVVVTDKDDKPIENLGIDDFEVVEGGKPQKIADFQFVSIPAVSRDIAVNVARQPEPDVAANTAPTPSSRLFVIVIDDLHLIEQDIVRIKRTLTDLVNNFSPDDEVAMVFVSHSNLGVNFTRNTSLIMARVDNIKAALGFGLDSLAAGPQKEDPDKDLATSIALGPASLRGRDKSQEQVVTPSKFRLSYARSAVQTLSMVSHSLAGSNHSRRAVFFVTGGTTIDPFTSSFDDSLALDFRTLQDEYLKVFDDATKADVPIYVIDPRGNASPEETVRGGCSNCAYAVRSVLINNIKIQHDNMAAIAVQTGGRAIFNASDMTRMMKEIVQENGSYYLLGYYPDPFAADGKFHELKVHVKRPGARVRARAGYEAPSAARASTPVADAVSTAISAAVNVSGLALRAFAEPITSDGKTTTVAVTVEVTYPTPVDGAKRMDDNLELRVVALDADAKQRAASTRTHHFTAAAPPAPSVSFLINDVIAVPAQPLTLRVAVGSQALGKAGTVQLVVDVPRESRGLALGGMAIGFNGPTREPVLMPDAFGGLIPFQPTTTRTFATADVLRLFGHVYWKDKAATPAIALTVTGPGGAVNSTPSLIAQKSAGDQQDAVIAAMLPMQGMAAGKYHLSISATLPGGKPVTRDVLFEVK